MASRDPEQLIDDNNLNRWMFESSPDCVKLLDLEGRLLEMNRNGQCAMEVDDFSRLCGGAWQSFWPKESHADIEQSMAAAISGNVGRFSAFCPTAKGTPKWWDVTVTPVRGEDGRIEKLLSVSRDITALQIAKDEQRDVASRLQFMLKTAEVGEWELDLKSGSAKTSTLHDRCFGYDEPVSNWNFSRFAQHVHSMDREQFVKSFETANVERREWRFECRVVWPDQSVHWISGLGSTYQPHSRKPERMVGTVVDITERKRAEALANGQRSALELVVAGAPLSEILDVLTCAAEDGAGGTVKASVLILDEDGRRLRQGSSPSIPSEFSRAVDGVEIGPLAGACGAAAFLKREVVVRDIETDPRWHCFKELALSHQLRSCWSQPIVSARGEVLGTLAVYRDEVWEPSAEERQSMELLLNTAALILDRHKEAQERHKAEQNLRQVAQELEEANRRKTEFLATLAHELRNPLAPILSGLEVMSLINEVPASIGQVREMMERQTTHMSHLVDDLLDVARITSGKLEIRRERVALQSVVSIAIEASLPLIQAKQHELVVHAPESPLVLDADPTRIAQVVSNLLNNAAKYTPDGGRIELCVDEDENRARVSVTDNGIGLSSDALSAVFEMFAQSSQSTKSSHGGLGIGLTLVRRLVELHGGQVSATSGGINKGSKFVVELPILVGVSKKPSSTKKLGDDHAQHAQKGLRILIVDDNVDAAEMLSALLEMSGYAAHVAHDGYRALELADELQPDIVFLDLGLPGMDGYDVAREFRARPHLKEVRLVALTGWGSEEDRARSKAAGFDHHLTKPTTFDEIRAVLAAFTGRARAAAERIEDPA